MSPWKQAVGRGVVVFLLTVAGLSCTPFHSHRAPSTRTSSKPVPTVREPAPSRPRISVQSEAENGVPRIEVRGQVVSQGGEKFNAEAGPVVVVARPLMRDPAPRAAASIVRCESGSLVPSFFAVSVGQEVLIENGEEICHGFFSSSENNSFELDLLRPGEACSVRFQSPGPVHVYCSLHAGKQATIFVAPTPYFAMVDAGGEFRITGLEPGPHLLETWSESHPHRSAEILIPTSEAASLTVDVGELALGSG